MHNLQGIDLDIPLGKLVVICGVSGSGKTSLAFDTLYAEGQRRYIESFSPYVRQFLPQRDKPEYDRLENLPAAIAVKRSNVPRTNRSTVGTTAEVDDYLRTLYARLGELYCPGCQQPIIRHDPTSVAVLLGSLSRRRAMIAFRIAWMDAPDLAMQLSSLQESGFTRLIVANQSWNLATNDRSQMAEAFEGLRTGWVIVDRIATGEVTPRTIESLETAFSWGDNALQVFVAVDTEQPCDANALHVSIDGAEFAEYHFARELECVRCNRQFSDPDPRTFNFNSPLGACPTCEGTGEVAVPDFDKTVSNRRSYQVCTACHGKRLQASSLAYKLDGKSIDQVLGLSIDEARRWFEQLDLNESGQRIAAEALLQIKARLKFLQTVGLGYLTLDRPLRTLSGGEATRVALTTSLGSNLVSMLYVLDEPTIGLHPHDTEGLIRSIESLRDRGNSVVVVEHEPQLMIRADWLIEIGPQAGRKGGQVCFQGTVDELRQTSGLTANYLNSSTIPDLETNDSSSQHSTLRLRGARGRNLKNIDVDVPLNCLCVVTGVSGSGKSTLVLDTLGAALRQAKGDNSAQPLPHSSLEGHDVIRDCVTIDQEPISLSSRSNPATYTKLFDTIRRLFSESQDANRRGLSPSHFSFNSKDGQCPRCDGNGILTIDMQFLADIQTTCPDCKGSRYREEILDVKYRDRSIADCLRLSIEEARQFFRGQKKLQKKLDQLIEIGLGYVVLGQSLKTLSAGESQRIKLASYLSEYSGGNTLFLLDEPTTGLHFADVDRLIALLRNLVTAGHSVLVIEHNDQFIRAASHIIDLGPGAADEGGHIVATGTPMQIAKNAASITGKYLKSTYGL